MNLFINNEDNSDPMKEAFQATVGNGDPDESSTSFTSLFDLMTTAPTMDNSSSDTFSMDFAISDIATTNKWSHP